tara:strand:+ start:946 stop:2934 length:1989 start_codon:yes stop_codon:yes gene_type:complete
MASAEQKKSYQVIKQFKGLNTKANRTAIGEDEFSWLENAQPVGFGNLKIVPTQAVVRDSSNNAVVFSNTVTHFASASLNITDYVLAFLSDGSAEYYNVTTSTKGTVAVANTFSNAGIQVSQYNNDHILILDQSKGLYQWDGNNTTSIGSVGLVAMVNYGSGYTTAPSVTISGPDEVGGVRAEAVCAVTGNAVTYVTLTNAGSGYTNASNLTVTFAGGGGSNASAIAEILTFRQGTVATAVVNGGSGYTNGTTPVTFSGGGGTGAAGTAIIRNNAVSVVVMTNYGQNYTNNANITATISAGGSGANLVPVINNEPNVGVSSFSGRVWVAFGRSVAYSAAGSYSDFTSVSAGTIVITDSTLHGNIEQIVAANNFLYVFGDTSINVFSDVRVTTAGTTLFTNTNVSASVGSKNSYAIFPYFRSVLFMNDYGVYALVGSTTSKLSDSLDGMFANIDFTSPVYAGQVLINNILCAAFNFRYYDNIFTDSYRYIQAVFFEKRWFLTSQDNDLKYITTVPFNGKVSLYGISNNALHKLYASATEPITSRIQTALLPLTDPIRTKQALKFGIEATLTQGAILDVTVDSENGSSPVYTLQNFITWINNSNQTIAWTNNSSTVISWLGGTGYTLYKSDAMQWGKYLGLTQTSNSAGFVVNTYEFEHELRVRF